VTTRIVSGRELRNLAQELRNADRNDLAKDLRAAVRRAAGPARADVQAAILALRVKGTRGGGAKQRGVAAVLRARTERGRDLAGRRSRGLRRTIAGAVGIRVTARGVLIQVNSSRLPPGQQSLPMHLESRRGWRHPVFGDREMWAHQLGVPWFHATIRRHQPRFHAEIRAAMNSTVAGRLTQSARG